MTSRRRERPIKRTNPSGREVWVARYTGRDGKRKSAGTYSRRHEAQDAIDAAHAAEERGVPETVGRAAQQALSSSDTAAARAETAAPGGGRRRRITPPGSM
jgi:hypothetical protein